MNVEQALNAADESEVEGLRGLYPTAAQVLAAEVRYIRTWLEHYRKLAYEKHHARCDLMEAASFGTMGNRCTCLICIRKDVENEMANAITQGREHSERPAGAEG